jgi:DNA invertase Pin-like site-specific DNA recombinase
MSRVDERFGGRIRPGKEDPINRDGLVELCNEGIAFVYLRLSSHEQVRKHIYSLQAQYELVDLAKKDGYPGQLIHVETRDLGISGTLGQQERQGLAHLIEQIEAELIESVYVVQICRLFRDQTLIMPFTFGELCKQHGVIIVTPQMRLNLRDRMHMRIYRMEAERAADELEIMNARLHGGQNLKARQGHYGGGSIPPGYVLDVEKQIEVDGRLLENPDYHKYRVYEPHAAVVRSVFRMATIPGATVRQIVGRCRSEGLGFPPFPPELAGIGANVKAFASVKRASDGSWPLTVARVRSMLRNPAYIGWWIWAGELIKTDNHPAIVDEDDFWAVQEMFGDRPHRPKGEQPPLPLSGFIYCADHGVPTRMIYSHGRTEDWNSYQCRDEFNTTHCTIRAHYVDGPIGEAVVSQCSYPELGDEVLARLVQDYERSTARTASLRKERERLAREIEILEYNYVTAKLTPERAARVEALFQERSARLKALTALEKSGEANEVTEPVISQDDIDLVRRFLSNLAEGWATQPSDLKNAFLRLVLERVLIWQSASLIRARLIWRTGLEQDLVIHRPYRVPRQKWSQGEEEVIRQHYETMPRDELMALLPERTWRQIAAKGRDFELERRVRAKAGGNRSYASWEDAILRQHCAGELNMGETLARLDHRSEYSVRSRIKLLGLKRSYGTCPRWEWASPTFLTIECPVGWVPDCQEVGATPAIPAGTILEVSQLLMRSDRRCLV